MAEFIVSLVVTVMFVGGYHLYEKRTPLNKQMTWGEAMITSTYVFALFFWIYGVVPHYWLQWADGGLNGEPIATSNFSACSDRRPTVASSRSTFR